MVKLGKFRLAAAGTAARGHGPTFRRPLNDSSHRSPHRQTATIRNCTRLAQEDCKVGTVLFTLRVKARRAACSCPFPHAEREEYIRHPRLCPVSCRLAPVDCSGPQSSDRLGS